MYWPCQSGEDQQLLLWPDQVTLFGIIFFQIQLYASLLLQCFSLPRIFTVGMRGRDKPVKRGGVENSLVAIAEGAKLVGVCVVSIGLMTVFINPVFAFLPAWQS